MKRILALFCIALTVAPLGAQAGSVRGLAADLGVNLAGGPKLGVVLGAVIDAAEQDRHRRRNDNDDNDGRSRGSDFNRRDDDRGEDSRRDNRMDRAYAIASRYGRVQDVWPIGGSLFGARVSTDRGRIELEIDVNSGSARER